MVWNYSHSIPPHFAQQNHADTHTQSRIKLKHTFDHKFTMKQSAPCLIRTQPALYEGR